MQNDKICSELVSHFARTKLEANLLLDEVEALQKSTFKVGEGDFDSTLEKNVRAKVATAITQAIGNGSREETLQLLKEKLENLIYLNLTIAFEPTMEVVGRINTWVKQNVGPEVAMDITTDARILGGAIIEYKGKIAKLTLASSLDQYFTNANVNL